MLQEAREIFWKATVTCVEIWLCLYVYFPFLRKLTINFFFHRIEENGSPKDARMRAAKRFCQALRDFHEASDD